MATRLYGKNGSKSSRYKHNPQARYGKKHEHAPVLTPATQYKPWEPVLVPHEFEVGPFHVRVIPKQHYKLYRVYAAGKLIGKQASWPSILQCLDLLKDTPQLDTSEKTEIHELAQKSANEYRAIIQQKRREQ